MFATGLVADGQGWGKAEQSDLDNAPPILRKALLASPHLSYVGTRLVEFRHNGVAERHSEIITRRGDMVRIDFPDDSPQAGQVIVENREERRHYYPDKNEIQILPPRHEEALQRLGRIVGKGDRKFGLSSGGFLQVANIRTEQVVVSDKDGNVVQRIYIDPQTGLILKRAFFDEVGTSAGGFEFTRIEYSPHIDPSVFWIRRKGARIVTPAELLDRLARANGFTPVTLPWSSGFRLEGSNIRKIEGEPVLMQTYEGRQGRHLSLFQLKRSVSPDRLRKYAARQGFQFVSWRTDGNTLVLMGSIPSADLLSIAGPMSGGTASAG
jgi:outer membrane lipoprotein-sorting protein